MESVSSFFLLNTQSCNPSAISPARWKIPYLKKKILDITESRIVPFIAVTETWLKSYISDSQIEINSYNVERCDRGTRRGGGVLLYTHESIPITDVNTFDDKVCQALICKMETIKMIISVIYRPPDASSASFESCMNYINSYIADKDDYESCIVGDFNLPSVDWSSSTVIPGCTQLERIAADKTFQFMEENLHCQFIFEPTRGSNTLDLFMTNSSNLVSHVSVSDTPLSDHSLVEVFLSHNPCQPIEPKPPDFNTSSFRSLDFTKVNFDDLNSALLEINWDDLWDSCEDADKFSELFPLILLQVCESHCPKKRSPSKKQPHSLRSLSRKKRRIKKQLDKALLNPNSPTAQIRSLTTKLSLAYADIKDAINTNLAFRECQAVEKIRDNPKYFFSYAKKFTRQKQKIPMLFDENGSICTKAEEIANLLQKQFCKVFSDPDKTDPNVGLPDPPEILNPFSDDQLKFTVEDVISAIDEIKTSAAAGPDEIPVQLLKGCKHTLAAPIHMIWTHSIKTGIIPQCYKMSNIAPLHKKDSKADPANYRPVSLTSHVVKIYERILRKKMVAHLEDNSLLCPNQHGFRSGKSCLTQLLHHLDDILESLMAGTDVDVIYLDFAKAFDKVDHKLLLKKLSHYGFSTSVVKWIKSFLSDRLQKVVIDGKFSLLAAIISGVPQGTVLGPILFLIFINDIKHCIKKSTIRCFADDSRVSKRIASSLDVAVLQSDLDNVMEWSSHNNMTVHEDKFEYMCHRADKSNLLPHLPFTSELFQYTTLGGICLHPIDTVRDLGVQISDDLSWSNHVSIICDKARKMAAWVFSVFATRRTDVLLTLYKSLVRCHLEYCSPLWNPHKISEIQDIESIQRTFTSKIAGLKDLHYWDRLKELSLMSLQRRRERYIAIHMWKILHGTTSNDLQIEFLYTKRHGPKAKVQPLQSSKKLKHRTLHENSFKIMGPRIWNCIPSQICELDCLESFKNHLTKFVLKVPDKPPIRGYTPPNSNSILDWRNEKACTSTFSGGWDL